MGDWLSYEAADLLLFSEEVYWRLFELENAALWPLPAAAPLIFAGTLIAGLRAPRLGAPALVALLAVAWLWVGWSFVLQRYGAINWAAIYAAPFFAAQAVLTVWAALRPPAAGGVGPRIRAAGMPLCLFGIVLYPVLAPLSGRPLAGAEIVGIAPDPTAVTALGAALMQPRRSVRLALSVLPVIWLALSALTLGLLDGAAALVPAGVVLLAFAALGLDRSGTPQQRS